MPVATVDGVSTRYEVCGDGPPLLMFSPGGFNAELENWSAHGIYRRLRLIEHLSKQYSCVMFDRRESGRSGGRVQRLSWADYVAQARGLLDHLGIARAHLIGGCVGCSSVTAFAVTHPERVARMVLYSPAGGVHYRLQQHARLAAHQSYVQEYGLSAVVSLACASTASFTEDPRVGPWVTVIRSDPEFARAYAATDPQRYGVLISATARLLFDRDTVPGPEPEDLLALDIPTLIVPGRDRSHATSAARYLEECLAGSEYWDVAVAEQTETNAPARIASFLAASPTTVRRVPAP